MTRTTRRPLLLIDEHHDTALAIELAIDGMTEVIRCRLSMARAYLAHDSYAAILLAIPDEDWLSVAPLVGDLAEEGPTVVFCAAESVSVALNVVRWGGQDALAGKELIGARIRRVVNCAIVRGDERNLLRVRARKERRAAVRIVAAVIRDALQPAMTTLSRALEHPDRQDGANREALGALREVLLDLDEAGLAI